MNIEELISRGSINVSSFAADAAKQQRVTAALNTCFGSTNADGQNVGGSATFRAAMHKVITGDKTLTILDSDENNAHLGLYEVNLNADHERVMLTANGDSFNGGLVAILIHEIMHATLGFDDPREDLSGSIANPDYLGECDWASNKVLAELGMPVVLAYNGAYTTDDVANHPLMAKSNWTNSKTVDLAHILGSSTKHSSGVSLIGNNPNTSKNTELVRDFFWGNATYNTISSGLGDDFLYGRGGEDQLFGGAGSDYLDGGSGGADFAVYTDFNGDASGHAVKGASGGWNGVASVQFEGKVYDPWGGIDTLVDIEYVLFTSFDDRVFLKGDFSLLAFQAIDGVGLVELDASEGSEDDGDSLIISTSSGLTIDLEKATIADGALVISAMNFENVTGSEHDDVMIGNSDANVLDGGGGADELRGGAGDDRIIFDAADTAVFGGAGWDVGVVVGGDPISINLTAAELEVVIGGSGADNITAGTAQGTVLIAGGDGDDVITVSYGVEDLPTIAWGGGGADRFEFVFDDAGTIGQLGIAVVRIDGLTPEEFSERNVGSLGLGAIDFSKVGAVIINPDLGDSFYLNGSIINTAGYDDDSYRVFEARKTDYLGISRSIQSYYGLDQYQEKIASYDFEYFDVTITPTEVIVSPDPAFEGMVWSPIRGEYFEFNPDDPEVKEMVKIAEDYAADYFAEVGIEPDLVWDVDDSLPIGDFFVVGGMFVGTSLSSTSLLIAPSSGAAAGDDLPLAA